MQRIGTDEPSRLAALRSLTFLNSPRSGLFDDITKLAAHLLDAPIAFVSLVEEDFQWFQSCVGVAVDRTSRDVSFCSHAIAQIDPSSAFVVPDATLDPLFRDNPLVTGGMKIRMYAGQPLVTDSGHALGALCVIDTRPRQPEPRQLEALAVLARNVVSIIESRRDALALRRTELRSRLIIEASTDAVFTLDGHGNIESWNETADAYFGLSSAATEDRTFARMISPDNTGDYTPASINALVSMELAGKRRRQIELRFRRDDGEDFTGELSLVSIADDDAILHTAYVRDLTQRLNSESDRRERETREVVIFAMARLAESRDPETGAHIERVQRYCMALANQLRVAGAYADEIDDEFLRLLPATSPLHDIGKVGIPDEVLLKPGPLTPAEFEVMKTHTTIGSETLEAAMQRFPNTHFLRMARDIAATHHEKYNGAGYPRGLHGEQIPLCGRIVALADVYDALTSRRVYKGAMPHAQARQIILAESNRHFDPTIVQAFIDAENDFIAISSAHPPLAIAA